MTEFALKIIIPTKILRDVKTYMLVASGVEGEFGIMAQHAPMLVKLKRGYLKLYDKNDKITESILIDEGFCQVKDNQVIILTSNLPEEAKYNN